MKYLAKFISKIKEVIRSLNVVLNRVLPLIYFGIALLFANFYFGFYFSLSDCDCSSQESINKEAKAFYSKNEIKICDYLCDSWTLEDYKIDELRTLKCDDGDLFEELIITRGLILAKLEMKHFEDYVALKSESDKSRIGLELHMTLQLLERRYSFWGIDFHI